MGRPTSDKQSEYSTEIRTREDMKSKRMDTPCQITPLEKWLQRYKVAAKVINFQ